MIGRPRRAQALAFPLLATLALTLSASAQPAAKPMLPPKKGAPPVKTPMPAVKVPAPVAAPKAAAPSAQPPAAPPAAPASSTPDLNLDVRTFKLDNGLRVVLCADHASPTVAVDVVYDVGSRNEERGQSGFAHLFEHMMFQGSENVPRGEHFRLVTAHGGSLNGTTSEDRTNYFEMLPENELTLGLWLEADRMRSLDISQSNFENQRAVVKEEFRMRVSNAPYVPAYFKLLELTYQGYWPYEHPAIGSMPDLDAAQLDWVRAFHKAYYAPNNAVLSVAGDFVPEEAESLVRKHFGRIAAVPGVRAYAPPALPEQTTERTATVMDPHAELSAYFDGWTIPPSRDPAHYALSIASMVLSDGESSRLHRLLVRERAVAAEVEAETAGHRGPDAFIVTTKVASRAKAEDVIKLVDQEIARLAKDGPTDAEMTKAKNRIRSKFLFGLQSNMARAQRLAEFELYWGDASLLKSEPSKFGAVTKDDIKRAMQKYITPARRSRVLVLPQKAEAEGPKGAKG